ncbi:MAG TPA: hypothetical protein VM734_04840 [Kofleriaceae bacterium]|nr:hypothetical protein [Kofleriaceae bacterium]
MRGRVAALALGLTACASPRPAAPRADEVGLAVVIYAPRVAGAIGRAHVDDRRWLDVPADGELELTGVSSSLALDSVVLESLGEPGALTTSRCQVVASADGLRDGAWLVGHEVAVATAGGGEVTGTVVEVGDPVALVDPGDGAAVRVVPGSLRLDLPGEARSPVPGDPVRATRVDGDEVAGRLISVEPEQVVVRGADGRPHEIRGSAIVRLGVRGAPAETALRCAVRAARPGRHLIRLSYATADVGWRAGYRVVVSAAAADGGLDAIELVPQLQLHAPGFSVRRPAHVRLIAGLPDDGEPPIEAWRGEVTLGGGDVSVRGAPSRRRARLERVYRGAIAGDGENDRYPDWRSESDSAVWRELVYERAATDVAGPVRVGIAEPGGTTAWIDGAVPAVAAGAEPGAVRVPLWIEPDLIGFRRKSARDLDGTVLIDEVLFSVANRGDAEVTVTVEEELRAVARPQVVFARPDGQGELRRDRYRTTFTIAPGGVGKGVVALEYRFPRY